MGLLDAIGRFEEGLGAQFETYAVQRIRGAMLDGLRDNDWLPRSLRRDMRRIESAIHVLEQRHGRQPSESELAETLGMPLADYQKMLNDARGHQLVYFEDFADSEHDDFFEHNCGRSEADPLEILTQKGMRESLVRAIGDLPEREKMVMSLYYDDELNLREIGEVERLVVDSGGKVTHLIVHKGIVFGRNVVVPTDKILRVAEGEVWVDITNEELKGFPDYESTAFMDPTEGWDYPLAFPMGGIIWPLQPGWGGIAVR